MSPRAKEVIFLVVILACTHALAFGLGVGVERMGRQAKALKTENTALVDVRYQDAKGTAISQVVAKKSEAQEARTRVVYQTIKERIPVYVPYERRSGYLISNGTVRVWNAISDGDPAGLSAPPGKSEAEPSTVQPSDILNAHAADVEYCRVELGKYQNLWAWAELQAQLANSSHRK